MVTSKVGEGLIKTVHWEGLGNVSTTQLSCQDRMAGCLAQAQYITL